MSFFLIDRFSPNAVFFAGWLLLIIIAPCSSFSLTGSTGNQSLTPISRQDFRRASDLCTSASARLPLTFNDNDVSEKKLKVGIIGSGAVGSYYGARLLQCGEYDVSFHMRGAHYETCKTSGLQIESSDGDFFIPPDELHVFERPEDMGKMDWVIVALKSTSLDAVPELVAPLLTPNTRVLAIMNGLIEDDLISKLASLPAGHAEEHTHPIGVPAKLHLDSCAAIYGGMALICSNRIAPGQIHHSYAGLLSGGLAAASSSHSSETHQEALEQLWAPTKVEFKYEQSIVGGRWRKNVWNLPFNGISVAMGGITVDKIVNDPGLRRLADIVMDETIAVANADMKSRLIDPSCYLGDADVSNFCVLFYSVYHFNFCFTRLIIVYPMCTSFPKHCLLYVLGRKYK